MAQARLLACRRHHRACDKYARVGEKVNNMLHNFLREESTLVLFIPGNLSPSGYQCRRLEENFGGNKYGRSSRLGKDFGSGGRNFP